MTEQYQCQSYYDEHNVLRDCTCGKCWEGDGVYQAFDRARELKDKLDNLSAKHYDELFTKTDKQ